MFELFKAFVLGLVQGATEFLPVSSSGHLVIVPWLLGWEPSGLLFDTVLHAGTLISIAIVFWSDFVLIARKTLASLVSRSLADPNARLGWYIVVGSIPAAITGLLFKDFFENLFSSPLAAGCFLLVTAGLLAGSEQLAARLDQSKAKSSDQITWGDAIIIGLAQAIALAPGISRSGSTIAAGLARGLQRADAARYSFLLGTPAFLGGALLQVGDALATDTPELVSQLPVLLLGLVVSSVSGIIAIRFLLAYLRQRNLYPFALYCSLLGLTVIGLNLF